MNQSTIHNTLRALPVLLALALGACIEDEKSGIVLNPSDIVAASCTTGETVTQSVGNGVYGTCVDATFRASGEDPLPDPENDAQWVYLKFDIDGDTASVSDVSSSVLMTGADDSDGWDIAIQRSNIKLNGGVNGTGSVVAAGLDVPDGIDLELFDSPPFMSDFEWHVDEEVEVEEDFVNAYVMDNLPGNEDTCDFGWYHYGGCEGNHGVLSARAGVGYAVRTIDEDIIGLHVTGWQDVAGTSGYLQFLWIPVEEPEAPCVDPNLITHTVNIDSTLTTCVDASSTEVWRYLDLATGNLVTPATPENSDEWDIAIRRNNIKVNGGVSGAGGVEITYFAEGEADFDSVKVAPPEGAGEGEYDYYTDEDNGEDPDILAFGTYPAYEGEPPFIGIGWVLYNPAGGHTLAARDVVYVVRARDGTYYRAQFATYYKNTTTLQAGASGFVTFRWSEIEEPEPSE